MKCEVLDWILEKQKNISGKADEIWIKSVIQFTLMDQC